MWGRVWTRAGSGVGLVPELGLLPCLGQGLLSCLGPGLGLVLGKEPCQGPEPV